MDGRAAAVTGAAYLILLILIWKSGKKKIKNKEKRKRIRRGICFFLLVNTISVIVFIWTGQERPVKDGISRYGGDSFRNDCLHDDQFPGFYGDPLQRSSGQGGYDRVSPVVSGGVWDWISNDTD